ncbi:MAG TPA: YciC family protein [Gaiellaceae bacterium]|nr:YciC family protein [Gaiellaceae bacterium]
MADPFDPRPLPAGYALADALRVYRLLFQRSVLVAAIVYGCIALLEISGHVASGATSSLIGLVGFVATLAGPALVQGSLIEIVRNIHEARRPERVRSLFSGTSKRLLTLVGASIVYALGIGFGLVLLLVPGLIVMTRWSLMPAVVMLEGKGVTEARHRSSALVRGQSWPVFVCLLTSFLLIAIPSLAFVASHLSFGTRTFASFVWSAVSAPFVAHLLTVIYYRRAEPGRPVIAADVWQWKSVWEGR